METLKQHDKDDSGASMGTSGLWGAFAWLCPLCEKQGKPQRGLWWRPRTQQCRSGGRHSSVTTQPFLRGLSVGKEGLEDRVVTELSDAQKHCVAGTLVQATARMLEPSGPSWPRQPHPALWTSCRGEAKR